MVESRSGELLSQFLSLPVLMGSLLIGLLSLGALIWRWRTLSTATKASLVILCVAAWVLAFVLIGLSFAFGGCHPPAAPVPVPYP